MGSYIPEHLQQKVRRHRAVREVTAQHIVLANGGVVDPESFAVEDRSARFVLRLTQCGCFWGTHPPGVHAMVEGFLRVYADGHEQAHYYLPEFCKRGQWVLEETVGAS